MEHSGVLPTTHFAYWKGLGTCDVRLHISHTLESGQEARIVQIDFRVAFDTLNHQGILYKLCFWLLEVGTECNLKQFLKDIFLLLSVY